MGEGYKNQPDLEARAARNYVLSNFPDMVLSNTHLSATEIYSATLLELLRIHETSLEPEVRSSLRKAINAEEITVDQFDF